MHETWPRLQESERERVTRRCIFGPLLFFVCARRAHFYLGLASSESPVRGAFTTGGGSRSARGDEEYKCGVLEGEVAWRRSSRGPVRVRGGGGGGSGGGKRSGGEAGVEGL